MRRSILVTLITLAFAVPTFILGPIIWPPYPGVVPTPGQVPFLLVLAVIESLAFGLGVAFFVVTIRAAHAAGRLATAACIAVTWLLSSWWPHGNMHIHNGMELQGIIHIDYMFHTTLILAGCIVAYYVYSQVMHK